MFCDTVVSKQEQKQQNYTWPITENRYLSDFKDHYANKKLN